MLAVISFRARVAVAQAMFPGLWSLPPRRRRGLRVAPVKQGFYANAVLDGWAGRLGHCGARSE